MLFLKTVTTPKIDHQRLADRCRVVRIAEPTVTHTDYARARVVFQWLVIVIRQADERMVHMRRNYGAIGAYRWQVWTGRPPDQSDDRLDFCVIRKRLGARHVDRRTRHIRRIDTLPFLTKAIRDAVHVAQKKFSGINDDRSIVHAM